MNYADYDIIFCNEIDKYKKRVIAEYFFSFVQELFRLQHVDQFTRIREGQRPSLIDLVFSRELLEIDEIQYCSPIGKSDRVVMVFDYASDVAFKLPKTSYCLHRNYHKANYTLINEYFNNNDWSSLLSIDNVEEIWRVIKGC